MQAPVQGRPSTSNYLTITRNNFSCIDRNLDFLKLTVNVLWISVSHGQYVSNSPAELPMSSVKEQTLLWQGVGQPGYIGGDSGIHSGATTQVEKPFRNSFVKEYLNSK